MTEQSNTWHQQSHTGESESGWHTAELSNEAAHIKRPHSQFQRHFKYVKLQIRFEIRTVPFRLWCPRGDSFSECLHVARVVCEWQHTGDLIRIDAGDWYRRNALVHARLVSAVEKVPNVNAAVLLGNIEHRRSARWPVTRRQSLWRCRWTQYRARLQTQPQPLSQLQTTKFPPTHAHNLFHHGHYWMVLLGPSHVSWRTLGSAVTGFFTVYMLDFLQEKKNILKRLVLCRTHRFFPSSGRNHL